MPIPTCVSSRPSGCRDEKLAEFRPQIAEMLKRPRLDPREFIGLSTALARLDGKPVNDDSLAGYFAERLADAKAPIATRALALRAIPASYAKLKTEQLIELLKQDDPAFRVEVLRALKDRADAKAAPAVRDIAERHEATGRRASAGDSSRSQR